MKYNISNILTLLRIIVIPVIVICIYLKNPVYGWLGFVLFCLASITDYFDGYIARIRNEITNFGTFLDPIADKLLVAAVILILTSKEVIADWETIPALIILLREIAVSGLREYLSKVQIKMPVTSLAKFKTFIQMFAIAILLTGDSGNKLINFGDYNAHSFGIILLWLAAFLTIYTGYDYVRKKIHHAIE